MNIIVTGGAGFIGSNIALELDKEHNVTVIDDFSNSHFKNLIGFKGEVLSYDIRDIDWDKFSNTEVIFHQAAITDTRVTDQKKVMEVNANAFKKLLEYAVPRKIKVIYASSAAVYGRGSSPMRENQKLHPLNIYGFSKYIMDNIATLYMKNYPGIIGLRYFNVFGPNETHKGSFASMIYQLSLQMKAGKRPRIFKKGEQTRDHIYVKDVVSANIKMISYHESGIFNVGTGIETSFNDIVKHLNKVLGTNLEPEYIENPYNFYQERTCADITKIRKAVGFEPKYSVLEGIKDYFKNEVKNNQ
jgi:ADP-L-glycero-D-manno-heptose 6-epimerase